MPKLKTHRGAAKRLHKTGKGKFKRKRAFGAHILTKKSPGRKRHLRSSTLIHKADQERIEKLLPN